MKLLDYISPLWFFISLCIGIFLTYISTSPPKIVIKYPTPDNVDKNIYQDSADMCYKYEAKEVECPDNKDEITVSKLQHVKHEDDSKEGLFTKIRKKFFK